MAKSVIARILLVLLLFCSQGLSVCFDHSGNSSYCPPTIFGSDNGSEDPCQCPCEERECEEHEVKLDPLPAESIQVPSEPYAIVPFVYLAQFDLSISPASPTSVDGLQKFGRDPDPGLPLRSALLAGVVLRL